MLGRHQRVAGSPCVGSSFFKQFCWEFDRELLLMASSAVPSAMAAKSDQSPWQSESKVLAHGLLFRSCDDEERLCISMEVRYLVVQVGPHDCKAVMGI